MNKPDTFWKDLIFDLFIIGVAGVAAAIALFLLFHRPSKSDTIKPDNIITEPTKDSPNWSITKGNEVTTVSPGYLPDDVTNPYLTGITYEVRSGTMVITIEDYSNPCKAYQEMLLTSKTLADPKAYIVVVQETHQYPEGSMSTTEIKRRNCDLPNIIK